MYICMYVCMYVWHLMCSLVDSMCVQDFWKKCGDLGLLGITAPCKLFLQLIVEIESIRKILRKLWKVKNHYMYAKHVRIT